MSDPLPAEERFPELRDFELEIETPGGWTTVRANEDERAALILSNADAVLSMLGGLYRKVERDGLITTFRLTPKSWLEKKS